MLCYALIRELACVMSGIDIFDDLVWQHMPHMHADASTIGAARRAVCNN
jgi:hypothetical protein